MEESVVFTFPYQTNGNHAAELSIVDHIISERHWKCSYDFTETVNNFRLSEKQSLKFLDLFPTFLCNYTYKFENIFTAWSKEVQV